MNPPADVLESVWSVVLAAGSGMRLRVMTTTSEGVHIPKQFWWFYGDRSMLQHTLSRAESLSGAERIVAIVLAEHERWWKPQMSCCVAPQNTIVQTRNQGTALGVLLPLLLISSRDPNATVILMPSDHYVRNEATLSSALVQAKRIAQGREEPIVLLGITPDSACSDYGWIVPNSHAVGGGAAQGVRAFLEKPDKRVARALLRSGGLWSSFLIAARARALLRLYEEIEPEFLREARSSMEDPLDRNHPWMVETRGFPVLDFSRDLLQNASGHLCVLAVPPCGWSDLGVPERLRSCLELDGEFGEGSQRASLDAYDQEDPTTTTTTRAHS